MSYVDDLLDSYRRFVALPWPKNVAPPQRVWMAVYPPKHERRIRLNLPEFENATVQAGHAWGLIDITTSFERWMADHEYPEAYFEEPELLETALPAFFDALVAEVQGQLERFDDPDGRRRPPRRGHALRPRRQREGLGAAERGERRDRRPAARVLPRAARRQQLPAARRAGRLELPGNSDHHGRCSAVMTTNKELFSQDPTQTKIPNDGVAKVVRPETDQQWEVLEWELRSFVCEGEYERGLERILDSFLTNLGQAQQPAVWVSGFYGSGKSHLCRVLEYLWRDVELPSGETARSVVNLPPAIDAHFRELSTAGKRLGGLWSAAGTLGAGKSQAVRLAFLSRPVRQRRAAAAVPARPVHDLGSGKGYLDKIQCAVEAAGKEFDHEVHDLYVSPVIASALLEADPTLGDSVKDVRRLLQAQFPARTEDITDDEMFDAIEDVLRLQSDTEGKLPAHARRARRDAAVHRRRQRQDPGRAEHRRGCVFTLRQQRALRRHGPVRHGRDADAAEADRSLPRAGAPLGQGRRDRRPAGHPSQEAGPRRRARERARSGLAARSTDTSAGHGSRRSPRTGRTSSPDYPLLPTRRRFWELALRAIDRAGKAGVLRTQLRIVHEATREVADEPLGNVVGADFLYDQQAPILQQSGVLLKEISESILALKEEGEDGELKARISALVFLINSIPSQMIGKGETGLRATAPYIADLLVEDLRDGGANVRKRVPQLLEDLVDAGRLMRIDDEYRLQTEEGAEWEKEYRSRLSAIRDDAGKLARLRTERLDRAVEAALGGLRLTQGKSNTPRKIHVHFGIDQPAADSADVPVWVRDEWTVTESAVKNAAAQAGDEDPVVHVLLPRRDAESLKDALASHAAAQETVQARPTPQTDEGKEAQRAMKGRIAADEERLNSLVREVVDNARVYQGGGNDITESTLTFPDAVLLAARRSLVRLFPKFDVADNPNWGKVVSKARDGAPDALQAVGHSGEVPAHPVCKEVLAAISAAGTKGSEMRARFSSPPYGWDEDAIRGAVMALLATGHVRAAQDGKNLGGPKELEPRQIAKTTFYKEDEPPTVKQRLAVGGSAECRRDPLREEQGAGAGLGAPPEAAGPRRGSGGTAPAAGAAGHRAHRIAPGPRRQSAVPRRR